MMDADLIVTYVMPAVTAATGWFANAWRNRQKKDADVLQNVEQIIQLQRTYIEDQKTRLDEFSDTMHRLERRLESRERSIMKARNCPVVRTDDDCAVLADVAAQADKTAEQ